MSEAEYSKYNTMKDSNKKDAILYQPINKC